VSSTQNSSLIESASRRLPTESGPLDWLLLPLQAFARHKLAGAGVLMFATLVAVIWANSPWEHTYHEILHLPLGIELGGAKLEKDLHHWINDGLMAIFFFHVGLEIKREVLVGELSSVRKAALPAVAAVGGMVVPAAIYTLVAGGGEAASGWGVPMATDIAFALGVLALLGDRVPLGLRIFLTALAIVDDIGAVLVIAVFYTADLSAVALVLGFVFFLGSSLLNVLRVRNTFVYGIFGLGAWVGFLESGVHATIAALLIAFTIPARTRIDGGALLARVEMLIARFKDVGIPNDTRLNTIDQQHVLERLERTLNDASAPLQRIEHGLAAPVTFFVLPVFALANAGVTIHGGLFEELASPIALGIIAGLFLGKMVGITFTSWLAVTLGIADLPRGVRWVQVLGVAMLGGIGFTMALFIATLAFPGDAQLETAKVGVLSASVLSGLVGWTVVRASSSSSSSSGQSRPPTSTAPAPAE